MREPPTEGPAHDWLRVTEAENPIPHASLGFVGTCFRADPSEALGPLRPSWVQVELPDQDLRDIDSTTVRAFRIDEDAERFQLVPQSGFDVGTGFAHASIGLPGLYAFVGLPRDPGVLKTIETLGRWHDDLLEQQRTGRRELLDRICGLVLCPPPDEGPPGTICERCLGLEIPEFGLPELQLLRDPERLFREGGRVTVRNGKIAYIQTAALTWPQVGQIHSVDPDGTNRARVTNYPGPYYEGFMYPVWSPDGTQLACLRESAAPGGTSTGIWVIAADGSPQTRVTSGAWDGPPTWSPSGTVLAFASSGQIYTVGAGGGSPTNITKDAAIHGWPAWSPDGSTIAFESGGHIYLMEPDGKGRRALTDPNQIQGAYYPCWSPASTRVAFYGFRGSGQPKGIYVIDVATGATQPIVTTLAAGESIGQPVWSPEGDKIAFVRGTPLGQPSTLDVHVVDADGTNETTFPESPGLWATKPTWQAIRQYEPWF
jgi:Tol biopolymer transport system component